MLGGAGLLIYWGIALFNIKNIKRIYGPIIELFEFI